MGTEVKFGRETDEFYKLLNPNLFEKFESSPFFIEEKEGSGRAKIKIFPGLPGFVIRDLDAHMQTPNFLACNRNSPVSSCADHAVFLFDAENRNWSLHIFELKRSPDEDRWNKILCQLNGAMIRAYAIAGVMRIPEFYRVCLYCGYRNDMSILDEDKSSPANLKSKRVTQRIQNSTNFLIDRFSLISYPKRPTKNHLIKLDDNGYAEIMLDRRGCVVVPRST